jgi:hypothetical protein
VTIAIFAIVGAVVIGGALGVVRVACAIDDARRERRRQRALDSFMEKQK